MVELDQFKYTLSTYDETLKEVKDSLDLENKERRITELDKSMEESQRYRGWLQAP